MRKLWIFAFIGLAALVLGAGWQIASWELANLNLQDEMRDLASQAGAHVGFVPPTSDEDARKAVVLKAQAHGIELSPEQVTVLRKGSEDHATLSLSVEYSVPVNLVLFSFHMHFSPSV